MTTLKEEAQAYTPKQILNITDLDRVDISFPVVDKEGIDQNGKPYSFKVMVVNGMEYRVPVSVLEEIKKMLELKPDLTHVKVTKAGSGLGTKYSVRIA